MRALACGRAAKESVRGKEGPGGDVERGKKRDRGQTFAPRSGEVEEQAERGEGKKVGKKGLFELSLCAKQPPGFSGTRRTRLPLLLRVLPQTLVTEGETSDHVRARVLSLIPWNRNRSRC